MQCVQQQNKWNAYNKISAMRTTKKAYKNKIIAYNKINAIRIKLTPTSNW